MVISIRLLLFLLYAIKLSHRSIRLPFHIDERLKHLVADRDDLRVRLEAALRDNHVGELVRNVDIGHLERGRRNRDAEISRRLNVRRTGVIRLLIEAVPCLRKTRSVRELCNRYLRFCLLDTIRICTCDNT